MNRNIKGVLTVAGVAIAVLGIWHFTHQNKKAYAKVIAKNVGASYIVLLTFDEEYLKAWVKGISKKKNDFSYNNETYSTQTGKKIQS